LVRAWPKSFLNGLSFLPHNFKNRVCNSCIVCYP
jgi:hypothetical protein